MSASAHQIQTDSPTPGTASSWSTEWRSIMYQRKTCRIIYVVIVSVGGCVRLMSATDVAPTYDESLKITRLLLTQFRTFRRTTSRRFRFLFFDLVLHAQRASHTISCWSIVLQNRWYQFHNEINYVLSLLCPSLAHFFSEADLLSPSLKSKHVQNILPNSRNWSTLKRK